MASFNRRGVEGMAREHFHTHRDVPAPRTNPWLLAANDPHMEIAIGYIYYDLSL